MVWTLVRDDDTAAVASGNITVTVPAGNVGDVVIASIAYRGNATFTAPAGWTILTQQSSGNTTADATGSISSLCVAAVIDTGSLATTFTRTGGDVAIARITRLRSSISGTPTFSLGSASTLAAASVTPSTTGFNISGAQPLLFTACSGARNVTFSAITSNSYPINYPSVGSVEFAFDVSITDYGQWHRRASSASTTGADVALQTGYVQHPGLSGAATGVMSMTTTLSARHAMAVIQLYEPTQTPAQVSWDKATAMDPQDWVIGGVSTLARRWDSLTGVYFAYTKSLTGYSTGKRVFRFDVTTAPAAAGMGSLGLSNSSLTTSEIYPGASGTGISWRDNGNVLHNALSVAYIAPWTAGMIGYILVDLDSSPRRMWIYSAGTYYPGNPASVAGWDISLMTGTVYPTFALSDYAITPTVTIDGAATGLSLPSGFSTWQVTATSVNVTGASATGAVGTPTLALGSTQFPTGVQGTTGLGVVAAGHVTPAFVEGLGITGSVGTAYATAPLLVPVTGVLATGGVGTIVSGGQSVTTVLVRGVQGIGNTEYAAADYGNNSIVPSQYNQARAFTDSVRFGKQGGNYYSFNQQGMKTWSFGSTNNRVIRTEVRQGDVLSYTGYSDPPSSERAETVLNTPRFPDEQEILIRFNFILDAASPVINSGWLVFIQLHSNNGSSPPMELAFQGNDRMTVIQMRGTSSSQIAIPGAYTSPSNLIRGKTYKCIMHVKFSSAGFNRVYLDGALVNNMSGDIGFSDQFESYLRFGIYRATSAQTQIIHHGDMQIRSGGVNQVTVLTGRFGTGQVGGVTIRFPLAPVTGVVGTTSVGNVTTASANRLTQTGVSAIGAVGTALATTRGTASPTGVSATTQIGIVGIAVTVTPAVIIGLTSFQVQGSVGTVTIINNLTTAATVTGLSATGATAAVSTAIDVENQETVSVTGVFATGMVGTRHVIRGSGWFNITVPVTTIWTEISG